MLRIFSIAVALVLTFSVYGQTAAEKSALKNDIEKEITTRVLPYWLEYAIDPQGGFYGIIAADGTGIASAPKGSVLAGRLIWTFASAYRIYGVEEYKDAADQLARYYIEHFIDPVNGGTYWSVDSAGLVLDSTKQAYASAFGIYGLSEHFRATGCHDSLDKAIALYRTINDNMCDTVKGGYREAMSRDFTSLASEGVDGHKNATKTMNTHIHLLESFTNLYRVWPDSDLAEDIRALISILGNQLFNRQTAHLVIFCDDDWNEIGKVESYGHDIETSWLLTEAAEVLGNEALIDRVKMQAVRMTDAALAAGLDSDGGLNYELSSRGMNHNKAWWVQCEAIIGCLNAWQITGDSKYFRQAEKFWQYIQSKYIDAERGEWFHNTDRHGNVIYNEPKGSMWNCPYHNSRLAFEAGERLD